MHPQATFIPTGLFPPVQHHHRSPLPRIHHRPRRVLATPHPTLSAATRRPTLPAPPPPPTTIPLSLGPFSLSIPGRLLLCAVPLLWASFIACAKLLYLLPRALPPASFNAARLIVSSLFFLPTLLRARPPTQHAKPHPKPAYIFAGLELGSLMFIANLAQIFGLRHTQASRAAFLNQLSTVLVPLVAALCGLEALSGRVLVGAACALAGVALLTVGGGGAAVVAAGAVPWLGDVLEVLAACLFTLYVLRVSYHARKAGKNSGPLVAVKVVTQAGLSLVWLGGGAMWKRVFRQGGDVVKLVGVVAPWTPVAVLLNVFLVVWAGAMVSAASSWMQTMGQKAVPASEAAILYAAQPLWASVIATLFLGETLGGTGMLGAGFIVVGTVVSTVGRGRRGK